MKNKMEKKALIKEEHAMTAEKKKGFGPTKKFLGVLRFLKKDPVLTVSWILAIGSAFWIPPDSAYLDYLDLQTLGLLFCLMTITGGLQNMGFFSRIGGNLIRHVANTASLAGILVALCFFSSMIITNDVALITFVPFTMVILDMVGKKEKMIPIVTMQTIAANLGSMVTPIGNPQNLYLYSQTDMGLIPFMRITLPYAAVTALFLLLFLAVQKKEKIHHVEIRMDRQAGSRKKEWMYAFLFLLALGVIIRLIPMAPVFFLTAAAVAAADRNALKKVDYALLLTFIGFFIFIGNMKRIPWFCQMLTEVVKGNEILTAVITSQVISNVPSALLLSGFTDKVRQLVIGTNLGGLGTLIASMASLISYKQVVLRFPERKGAYFIYFTAANVVLLAILLAFHYLVMAN